MLPRQPRRRVRSRKGERRAFVAGKGFVKVAVHDGDRLCHGNRVPGPAIIESVNTTVVVPGGWRADYDALGNCVLTRS